MRELLLPIAKTSSGHYISIENAEKPNTFYCPDCESPLIIKEGDINRKHFSHPIISTCKLKNGGESLYHKVAKDIICEEMTLKYNSINPAISIKSTGWSKIWLNDKLKTIKFSDINQERKIKGYNGIADLEFTDINGYSGYVEIVFAHKIDERKSRFFQDNQVFVIEVIIPKNIDFTYESLRDHIISGKTNKLFSGDWAEVWAERYFKEFKEKVMDKHFELEPDVSDKLQRATNVVNQLEMKKYRLEQEIRAMEKHLWGLLNTQSY